MEAGHSRPARTARRESSVVGYSCLVQHKHRAYSGVGLLYCQIELSF